MDLVQCTGDKEIAHPGSMSVGQGEEHCILLMTMVGSCSEDGREEKRGWTSQEKGEGESLRDA